MKDDLRAWVRWMPDVAITVLLWGMLPVHCAAGAFMGMRDGLLAWKSENSQWRELRKRGE